MTTTTRQGGASRIGTVVSSGCGVTRRSPAGTTGTARGQPDGRLGRPDEAARAIAFLAFDATFTTGTEPPVDGGPSQL